MQHSELSESVTNGRVSLYAAGYGAASVGIVVMGRAVDDTGFALFTLVLLAIGFSLSAAVRLGRFRHSVAEGSLLALLSITTILIFTNPAFRYVILPLQSLTSSDLVLSTILVWLMVVYSFNLRTDRSVLFMCVPPLSLIGLMSTFDPGSQSPVFFIMYLCFACFALVQQNALSHAAPEEHREVRGNLKLSIVITLQAIAVGAVLGWVMQTVLDHATGPSLLARNVQSTQEPYLESDFMEVASGPTALGEQEIMTVMCNEPLLWRSQVYDRYTGRGWMSTLPAGDQPVLVSSPGHVSENRVASHFQAFPSSFVIPTDHESRNRRSVKRVDQIFTVTDGKIGSLCGAAEPVLAAFHGPQMLLSANGRIGLRLSYGKGGRFAVSSLVSTATARQLRSASSAYPRDIEIRYIQQVPDPCRRLQHTVDELVSQLPSEYDKVVAIQNYLEMNYVYDLTAPGAPVDEDAVVHFLLKSRRGYCDVFASAMAVMCRLAGIPSRVATGYASGKREDDKAIFHVRQRDRHAWVEVYFPEYGWISFDPAPQEARRSLSDRLTMTWRRITNAIASQSNSFWMIALLFYLVGYLLKVEIIDKLIVRRLAPRPGATVCRAAENYRRMCDVFARLGYPRPAAMTPNEYYNGLEKLLRPNCANLVAGVQAITDDFVEARYAGRQLPRERVASTTARLGELVREAKQAAKQKLLPDIGDPSGWQDR